MFDLPLAEVIYDLHDKLKSATRGYGTMNYELIGYAPADLVRLSVGIEDVEDIIADLERALSRV